MTRYHGKKRVLSVYLDDADRELLEERANAKGVGIATEARMILLAALRNESSEREEIRAA